MVACCNAYGKWFINTESRNGLGVTKEFSINMWGKQNRVARLVNVIVLEERPRMLMCAGG